MYNNLITNF